MLSSYYDFDGWKHHSNELAIEAVRLRYLYCCKLVQALKNDKYFFIREQMRWLGKDCTQEWLESSGVCLSQPEISEISAYLDSFYHKLAKGNLKNLQKRSLTRRQRWIRKNIREIMATSIR